MKTKSRAFDPSSSNSFGRGIYYVCERCNSKLDSSGEHAVACKCCNLILDIDAGRISAKQPECVEIVEEVPD